MSNEPTITQMNVAIARFEGRLFYGKFHIDFYGPNTYNEYPVMKYHKDWDWLMPVVRKIYDTLADMLKKRPPHTACQGDLIEVDIHCAIREVDILKAHGHVYQFCLWYNKQKEANNEKTP